MARKGNGRRQIRNKHMKSKEDLFQLIQSMSKSEKRYFTLDAQKSGRRYSKYLELFQAINEMEAYDEDKMRKKFGRHLPSDKSYLYESILRSMRDYRSSKSKAAQIKELTLDARFLYERGLYEQSEERLIQAKQMAHDLDDQLALLEITREQLNFVWTMKKKDYGASIEGLLDEKEDYIDNINEELKYLSLAYKLQMAKNDPELKQDEAAMETAFPAEGFQERYFPASAHAQRRFLQSAAQYHDLIEDFDRANGLYFRMVEWWDQFPAIKEEEYVRYIADVFNLLHASYSQKKYQQFESLLKRIEQEKPGSYHDQRLIFKQLTNYKILYHINFGISEGSEALVQQVEEGMAVYKLNPVSQLIIAFNLTLLLFILGKFSLCQRWAEKVLRDYNRTINNPDFRLAANLVSLLAAYDNSDIDRLDSALRAFQRSLKLTAKEERSQFFSSSAQHIKLLSNTTQKHTRAILKEFEDNINAIRTAGQESIPLGLDELVLAWIRSQKEGKTMRAIVREAVGSNTNSE